MSLYSYHIFYFPFRWDRKGCKNKIFTERFDLNKIKIASDSQWQNISVPLTPQYQNELYNEKNFYYDFVHSVLYDNGQCNQQRNPIIRHFERKEAYNTELRYNIKVIADHESFYELKLKSIVLNLYSTGTGIIMFYIENEKYPELDDVRRINQFGRRVYPPFLDARIGVAGTKYSELADFIEITGLHGPAQRYSDDFTSFSSNDDWKPARFITSLIEDLTEELEPPKPVVDDRMFTQCWYFNYNISAMIKDTSSFNKFVKSVDWNKFLFVDGGSEATCRNSKMLEKQNKKHTYKRWQQNGTLYGITRYSFVAISNNSTFAQNVLLTHMRTIYARMAELALLQRASTLKFSDEVTVLSQLSERGVRQIANRISNFYKEYIKFVNQIYFREVTAQEQGIELYTLMQESMKLNEQVKGLDAEIEELHNYVALLEDKKRNKTATNLNLIAVLFIPASFIATVLGIGFINSGDKIIWQACLNDNVLNALILIIGGGLLISGLILFIMYFKSIINSIKNPFIRK